MNRKLQDQLFETVYHAAQARGALAATKHVPTPMVVQEVGLDDKPYPGSQSYYVEQGVCGFAWVVVTPGTCAFARWLKKHDYAKPHYYGGVSIWVSGYGQCYEKKVAHATVMAAYLRQVGIKAHAGDRLD